MNIDKDSINKGDRYVVLTALDNKYCEHMFGKVRDIKDQSVIFHRISENCSNIAIKLKNNLCSNYTSSSNNDKRITELKGLVEMNYESEYYVLKLEYEDYSKVNIIKPSYNTPMDLNQNPQKIIYGSNSLGNFNIHMEDNLSKIKTKIYNLIGGSNIMIYKLEDKTLNSFYNMYSVECNHQNKNIQTIDGFKIVSYDNMTIRKD